jgi:hypothetical protein
MEPPANVFISYSQKDKDFVERLKSNLQMAGLRVWMDVEQIAAGSNWQKAIEHGLEQASVLLYVSSMHSIDSLWIAREIEAYRSSERKVIPIVIDDVGARNMPSELAKIQWVDFRQDYAVAFDSLKAGLIAIVGEGEAIKARPKKIKGYVFLSYAEEDSEFLVKLRRFLKDHGYAYWDYEESDRDYQAQLFLELEGVISEAAASLSILSPSWKRSQWTVKEYLFSEEINTPVFLLKAKELGPTIVIAGMPYIDFTKDTQRGFEKLARELQRKGL